MILIKESDELSWKKIALWLLLNFFDKNIRQKPISFFRRWFYFLQFYIYCFNILLLFPLVEYYLKTKIQPIVFLNLLVNVLINIRFNHVIKMNKYILFCAIFLKEAILFSLVKEFQSTTASGALTGYHILLWLLLCLSWYIIE